MREAERASKAAERASLAAQRADAASKKAAEKEATRLLVESREAEVAELNAALASTYADVDTVLQATLNIDDFVDLKMLKATAEHPPFEPGALGEAADPPVLPADLGPPVYEEPEARKGLGAAFGGKKRHAAAVEAAQAEHSSRMAAYEEYLAGRATWLERATAEYQHTEQQRLARLADARAEYEQQCQAREDAARERNEELARLINDLAFDVPAAIEEYVDIVLSNSVYPDAFPVEYDHTFDLSTRELTLTVSVPEPATLPSVKEYRYVKAKDEIAATALSLKAQRYRYASAVHQTALRTLHEVFEADRAAKIRSVALTVGVDRIAPATGLPETVPLVQVATDRATFTTFDLSHVVAQATLEHLGAALSKNPLDLAPADTGRGVRQRST